MRRTLLNLVHICPTQVQTCPRCGSTMESLPGYDRVDHVQITMDTGGRAFTYNGRTYYLPRMTYVFLDGDVIETRGPFYHE